MARAGASDRPQPPPPPAVVATGRAVLAVVAGVLPSVPSSGQLPEPLSRLEAVALHKPDRRAVDAVLYPQAEAHPSRQRVEQYDHVSPSASVEYRYRCGFIVPPVAARVRV